MSNRNLITEASNGKLTSLTSISSGGGHKLNSEAAAAILSQNNDFRIYFVGVDGVGSQSVLRGLGEASQKL